MIFRGAVTVVEDGVPGVPGKGSPGDQFLGIMTVLEEAPKGMACPYLGSVRLLDGDDVPSGHNFEFGAVVILAEAPKGHQNLFLGSGGKGK